MSGAISIAVFGDDQTMYGAELDYWYNEISSGVVSSSVI